MRPLLRCLLVSFCLASFSYSCSSSKAGISTPLRVAELSGVRYEVIKFDTPVFDNTISIKKDTGKPYRETKSVDSNAFNKMILDNQRIGMLNDSLMLVMMNQLNNENHNLKHEKKELKQDAVISKVQRQSANEYAGFNEAVNKILLCFAICFILLIIIIFILIKLYKKSV